MSEVGMPHDLMKLTDPSFLADGNPHDVWRRLRAEDPIAWTPETNGPGFWSLTRYGDGVVVFKDSATFSSARGTLLEGNRWEDDPAAGKMLALMDPPRHTQVRHNLTPFFTSQRISAIEANVCECVYTLARRCSELREFDFVGEIADRLSANTFFTMLGIPAGDWDSLFHSILGTVSSDESKRSVADVEMLVYLSELAASRRNRPGDDLLSALATMDVGGCRLSDEEVVLNFANVISAGVDTTRLAISAGFHALLQHPEQWQLLREDPSLVELAVEEMVRWASPTLALYRTATKDIKFGERRISRNDRLAVWLPSLNRDERVFTNADVFNINRDPNPHVGFGVGGHYCLGAVIARLELRVLVRELTKEWSAIEQGGEARRIHSLVLQGIDYLPVSVTVE